LQPHAKFVFVAPDAPHFGAGVAGYHPKLLSAKVHGEEPMIVNATQLEPNTGNEIGGSS
jgi:hypothetical protein